MSVDRCGGSRNFVGRATRWRHLGVTAPLSREGTPQRQKRSKKILRETSRDMMMSCDRRNNATHASQRPHARTGFSRCQEKFGNFSRAPKIVGKNYLMSAAHEDSGRQQQ